MASSNPPDWRRTARRLPRIHGESAYLFLTPWLIGFLGLTLGPMLASLYLSFTEFQLVKAPEWSGIDNYVRMFTADRRFWKALSVTFTYVALSVPAKLIFALAIAILLDKGIRGLTFYRALFYLPSLLGTSVAIAVMWRQVFGLDGLFNDILALIGIQGPSWITNPGTAIYTLVLLSVWQFGSPMIIFLAGLRQIPRDLYDAASVDGASAARQFVRITLPLLAPVILFNIVLRTIDAFKAFTPAFIISSGTGGPIDATLFYTLYLYQQGFSYFHMGYASAMAWVLLNAIAVFTAIIFMTSRYWVHYEHEQPR
jgi:multiple sugar transport system permease protein